MGNKTTKNKIKKGSAASQNSSARLSACQAVYQLIVNGNSAKELIKEYRSFRFSETIDDVELAEPNIVLFSLIIKAVEEHKEDLERIISDALGKGSAEKKLSDIDSLLASILYCGAAELLTQLETDSPIIISDYIDVTHAFYEAGEAKLVNAVLDRVNKVLR
jgi:N utilization substance protein B